MKNYDEFVKTAGVKNFVSKVSGRALRDVRKEALKDYKETMTPYVKANAALRRNARTTLDIYNNASDIYDLAVRQHSKASRGGNKLKEEVDKLSKLSRSSHKEKSIAERNMLNAIAEHSKAQAPIKDARESAKVKYRQAIDEAVKDQDKARKQLAIGGGITLGALIAAGALAKGIRKKHKDDEEKTAAVKLAQIESPSPAEKKHMNEDEKYVDAPVAEKSEKCAGKKRGLSKKDRDKILKMLNLSRVENNCCEN